MEKQYNYKYINGKKIAVTQDQYLGKKITVLYKVIDSKIII